MIYLCLDPGRSHTGVAISYEGTLSIPLTTLHTSSLEALLHALGPLIATHRPDVLVIGQPQTGPIHQLALDLSTALRADSYSVVLAPEDGTSLRSQTLLSTHRSPLKRKLNAHQAAAALILQHYLDNLE